MKVDYEIRAKNDLLSILVFAAASYLSLNVLHQDVLYHFLGSLFLVAMLYGIICNHKKAKFIF